MRSSSPLSPSPSPHHSHLVSSHRIAQRTYSKRAATYAQTRKAQAALPSSDTEGSDDDSLRSRERQSTRASKKMKRSFEQEGQSPSSVRTARWTVSLEKNGAEEQEDVEAHLSKGRFESSNLSDSDRLSKLASPARCATPTPRTKPRTTDSKVAGVENPDDTTRTGRTFRSDSDTGKEDDSVCDSTTERLSFTPAKQQPLQPPSTPPRASGSGSRLLTPHSSPRDLSAIFAAVSPRQSPSKLGQADMKAAGSSGGSAALSGRFARAGGLRRMLTKTQSLGGVRNSPSNRYDASIIDDHADSPSRQLLPTSGPSTPSRSPGRTQSLPESPLESSPNRGAPLLVTATMKQAQDGVGGKTKKTYGGSRSFLVREHRESADSENAITEMASTAENHETLVKESYAELRKRYEVHNGDTEGEGHGSRDLMAARRTTWKDLSTLLILLQDLLLARAPQPVSDMRSKGENRRFMDEVGYLAEGIADPATSLSLKRAT